MIHYSKRWQAFAVASSGVAGYVDAVGYLHFGGLFASFMSGNSTQLGVSLAGHGDAAGAAAGIIGLFVGSVAIGETVGRLTRERRRVSVMILVSAVLLAAAAFAHGGVAALATSLMVVAMGAENATFQRNEDVSISLTYMTGTLVKVGQRLAAALFGGDRFGWLPYVLLWAGLVCGAFVGTRAYAALGLEALWAAGAAAVLLTFCAAVLPQDTGAPEASAGR